MPARSHRNDKERIDWLERQSCGQLVITRIDLKFGAHYVQGSNRLRDLIDMAMDLEEQSREHANAMDRLYHDNYPNQTVGTKRYEGEG